MDRAKLYQDRLTELGWTEYRLAQEIAKKRSQQGNPVTTQQIYSAIRKCVNDPANSKQSTNDEIITALMGETVIRWTTYQEIKL
jgi:hypothetical protein